MTTPHPSASKAKIGHAFHDVILARTAELGLDIENVVDAIRGVNKESVRRYYSSGSAAAKTIERIAEVLDLRLAPIEQIR